MTTNCPHCGVLAAPDDMYCASCGKAVSVGPNPTRLVDRAALASTHAGQSLQSESLRKQMKSAFGALLAVAIVQTLATLLVAVAAANFNGPDKAAMTITAVVIGVIAIGFYGLAFWARKAPLPAAITGLSVLVTLWAIDALLDPTAIVRGIILKVIVIVLLIRAINAGLTHRRLARELELGKAAAA